MGTEKRSGGAGLSEGDNVMGWATNYITRLQQGKAVEFRPRGNSMAPRIRSGQLCRVGPLVTPPRVGDVVLCRVNGREYLHLVTAIQGDGGVCGPRYQIGNNRGRVNGWTRMVFGKLVKTA